MYLKEKKITKRRKSRFWMRSGGGDLFDKEIEAVPITSLPPIFTSLFSFLI
jgi:hypothetical protein